MHRRLAAYLQEVSDYTLTSTVNLAIRRFLDTEDLEEARWHEVMRALYPEQYSE